MAVRTWLTDLLGLSIPVIQAPMAGGGDTVELVAASSNAGALGCIGAAYLTPEQIIDRGRAVRARTSRPFGVNLFAPMEAPIANDSVLQKAIEAIAPYYQQLGLPAPAPPQLPKTSFDDQLPAALECGARLFSFTFGALPPATVKKIKDRGILVAGTATTVSEAKILVETGVDAVIAQGSEAGGHRGTFAAEFESGSIGSMALIPQVADAVPVPVIASGGIMDGRGIASALLLGAAAIQMGTAFLACDESGIPQAYKDAIFSASEHQTRITRAFSGRPARGIINRVLRDYEETPGAVLPFPLQNALTRPLRTEAAKQNCSEYLSLWAGQGLGMARRGSVAQLIEKLAAELSVAVERIS